MFEGLWRSIARHAAPYIEVHQPIILRQVRSVREHHDAIALRVGDSYTPIDLTPGVTVMPIVVLDLRSVTFGVLRIEIECLWGGEYVPYLDRKITEVGVAVEERLPPCDGLRVKLTRESGLTAKIPYHVYLLGVESAETI